MAVMEFGILGPLEVRADGRTLELGGPKPRALLAVLALNANQPVTAERVAIALWGEDTPPRAVKTVQVYVARLRKALGDPDALVTTPAGYSLRVRPGELDAERFEQRVATGREALAAGRCEEAAAELREALELWRGPPLAELASAPFAPPVIAHLEEQQLAALEARVEADLAAGRHAELVGELEHLVAEHPLRERLRGQLMLALYRAGRQAEALETYRTGRALLATELGLEPGPALRRLEAAVLAQEDDLDLAVQPANEPDTAVPALPRPATRLIGRELQLTELDRLVRHGHGRLVTLLGPGGVGKTRLAIALADQLALELPAGAHFVSLAPLSDPEELPSAVVLALGVPSGQREAPNTALRRFLANRSLLLVLDNFEHLLAAAPDVAAWLDDCEGLRIVVTSRAPLNITAEQLFPVGPLAVPTDAENLSPEVAGLSPAVAMFLDRMRARDPDFTLDEHNARHISYVCRRLEGLPLALELAAARTDLLGPADLAARIDHALALLTRGASDLPERQRTLRATIDWSYRLLTEPERRAFARTALFPGGAAVDAAEAVTRASIEDLDSLVAKQLLVRRAGRLTMLEVVREYARERLDADPDVDSVRHDLATWALEFARGEARHLLSVQRHDAQARLDAELPNLRAVLRWALDTPAVDIALSLVTLLGPYWHDSFRREEGRRWTDEALTLSAEATPELRARALIEGARLLGSRQAVQYRARVEAALAIFQASNDRAGSSQCLALLARSSERAGDKERARSLAEEAVALAARSGDVRALSLPLAARVVLGGDYWSAMRHAPEAIQHLKTVEDHYDLAQVSSEMGVLALGAQQYENAVTWLEEASSVAERLRSPLQSYLVAANLGVARLFLGQFEQAHQAFIEALAISHELDTDDLIDEALLGVAIVAARGGQPGAAARLLGAAESHQSVANDVEEEMIWNRLQQMLESLVAQYDSTEWTRAYRQGARLSTSEAIELARLDGAGTLAR